MFDLDELFVGSGAAVQRFTLTDGVDQLFLSDDLSDGIRQRFLVNGFEAGDGVGFTEEEILSSREAGPNLLVYIDNAERDSFTFYGVDSVETLFGEIPLV